jgi:hypothetical protein
MSRFDDILRYDAQNEKRLQALMSTRAIPVRCPFCFCNGEESTEFVFRFFEEHYYDAEKKHLVEHTRDDGLQIFCVKCEEEIRVEDVK